jgi:hypothetical protein
MKGERRSQRREVKRKSQEQPLKKARILKRID